MSGFPILDLVVGIIFIYFLLSIMCSSAVELWLSISKSRAKLLEAWLKRIFDANALDSRGIPVVDNKGRPVSVGEEIMNHCMVTGLSKTGSSTSYISAGNFVTALLDKITIASKPKTDSKESTPIADGSERELKLAPDNVQMPPENLENYIKAIKNSTVISGELKRTILSFAYEASEAVAAIKKMQQGGSNISITTNIKSELDHFRDRLEKWYDTNSDRLTGALKRTQAQPKTIIVAVIITVALNVDSIEVSKYLYNNKEVSHQLADKALSSYQRIDSLSRTGNTDTLNRNTVLIKQGIDSLQALNLPLGWNNKEKITTDWKKHVLGWLATILAISLGAPFWFDILNKISNLRSTGPKPVVNNDSSGKK
ncbi:MAG: hypothetical protein ABI707_04140 [Ferruginibacter sp.]